MLQVLSGCYVYFAMVFKYFCKCFRRMFKYFICLLLYVTTVDRVLHWDVRVKHEREGMSSPARATSGSRGPPHGHAKCWRGRAGHVWPTWALRESSKRDAKKTATVGIRTSRRCHPRSNLEGGTFNPPTPRIQTTYF